MQSVAVGSVVTFMFHVIIIFVIESQAISGRPNIFSSEAIMPSYGPIAPDQSAVTINYLLDSGVFVI